MGGGVIHRVKISGIAESEKDEQKLITGESCETPVCTKHR